MRRYDVTIASGLYISSLFHNVGFYETCLNIYRIVIEIVIICLFLSSIMFGLI